MDHRKILIVDDEKDLNELLALRLRGSGYEVAQSCDPLEGLALVERFHPDAILLDVSMPKIDGWEFCRRLRALPGGEKIPVMIVTAWLSDDLRRRAASAGAAQVMLKPYDDKEVVAAVGALAGGAAA